MARNEQGRREYEIWQACDALCIEGFSPHEITGERLKNKLYDLGFPKGSNTELYKYRRTWLDKNGFLDNDPASTISLSDPLTHAVSLLREQIRKELEAEFAIYKQAVTEEAKAAKEQLQDCQIEREQLITELQDLQVEYKQLDDNYSQTTEKLSVLKERFTVVEAENHYLQQQLEQQKVSMEQALTAQQQGFKATIQNLEKQLAKVEEQRQQNNDEWKQRLEQQRHDKMVEIDSLKTTIQKQQQQLQQTATQLNKVGLENTQLYKNLGQIEKALTVSQAKQDELASELKQKEQELIEQLNFNKLLNNQQKYLQQHYQELKQHNQQLEQGLSEIRQQLKQRNLKHRSKTKS